MSNRKVIYAKVLEGLFIPGAADLGKVLPPPSKTLHGLEMSLTDQENLLIKFKYNNRNFEVLVKDAHYTVLAPEADKPAPKAK